MINDLIELFTKAYEKYGDKLILDNYKPKSGLYIRINDDYSIDKLIIDKNEPIDKKLYNWFRQMDYYSVLIDMNKPIDPKKKIHSNNYMTLFMKKDIFPTVGDSPLSKEEYRERVTEYFNILKEPSKKLADKASMLLDSVPLDMDVEKLEKNRAYLLNNLDELIQFISQQEFKGYVAIFFNEDINIYRRESFKYLVPRIYNKNDFNVLTDQKVMGLSNSNMGMNDKKPYLKLMSRRYEVPYRIGIDKAIIIKKFFDWLSFQFDNIPYKEFLIPENYDFNSKLVDTWKRNHESACYYLYITKSKEVIIEDYESLPCYMQDITFRLKNIVGIENKEKDKWYRVEDRTLDALYKLELETDYSFFKKRLMKNYFSEPKINQKDFSKNMLNLFTLSKKAFHSFFKKGIENDLAGMIDKISMEIVLEHIRNGEGLRQAARAFNLRIAYLNYFSLGGDKVADKIEVIIKNFEKKISQKEELVTCQSDEEFYFAAGQLAYYIMTRSEAKKKNIDMFEAFMRVKDSKRLKEKLEEMTLTYGHAIDMYNYRFKNSLAMVQGYETEGNFEKYRDLFCAGLLCKNVIYTKKEKEAEVREQEQQEEEEVNENEQ
ncbi:MAG: hypothetical protein ACOZCL_04340 [Bacillota bacterium]